MHDKRLTSLQYIRALETYKKKNEHSNWKISKEINRKIYFKKKLKQSNTWNMFKLLVTKRNASLSKISFHISNWQKRKKKKKKDNTHHAGSYRNIWKLTDVLIFWHKILLIRNNQEGLPRTYLIIKIGIDLMKNNEIGKL